LVKAKSDSLKGTGSKVCLPSSTIFLINSTSYSFVDSIECVILGVLLGVILEFLCRRLGWGLENNREVQVK